MTATGELAWKLASLSLSTRKINTGASANQQSVALSTGEDWRDVDAQTTIGGENGIHQISNPLSEDLRRWIFYPLGS